MLYLLLVVVFSTLPKKWWMFLLIGWGTVVEVLHAMQVDQKHIDVGIAKLSLFH